MPTWEEFMVPSLTVLADGNLRTTRECFAEVADAVSLSPEDRVDLLSSCQPRFENRIGWALSYLSRATAVHRPRRGSYVITETGRSLVATHPAGLTEKLLRTVPGYVTPRATTGRSNEAVPSQVADAVLDPVEQVEDGVARIHDDVAVELLARLHGQEPIFFEQAVLDLLLAMGYGGAEGKATRTQLSNDGGIDGIIDQDALGLSRVYVQAKRYAVGNSVGRPEVQGFVGALHGNQANQGVFITTGRFSRGARDYAESVPSRVILIDGARLTSLMIRYGVGVQVKQTHHIVEIDEDFFA